MIEFLQNSNEPMILFGLFFAVISIAYLINSWIVRDGYNFDSVTYQQAYKRTGKSFLGLIASVVLISTGWTISSSSVRPKTFLQHYEDCMWNKSETVENNKGCLFIAKELINNQQKPS